MSGNIRKRKLQVRFAVCLLFLCLCGTVSSCGGGGSETKAPACADCPPVSGEKASASNDDRLDVWFFACSDDADSILLQTGGSHIMIDTGTKEDAAMLMEKLRALQVEEIDLLILTHPDKDHIGGAALLLDTFPVGEVVQTSFEKGSELQQTLNGKLEEETVTVPEDNRVWTFGKLEVTVYPPQEVYEDSNNCSLATLAVYENRTFFFAGDARKKRIGELLAEELPRVDVYKAAHHGRGNGKSDDLVERLHPAYAVITAEEAQEKTQQALREAGTQIISTYQKDVHFTVAEGILDVE